MKKCIITGSNGYLGSFLVSKFKKLGWDVLELSSSNKVDQIKFKLHQIDNIDKEIFRNCNLLINTSYDFAINESKRSWFNKTFSNSKIYEC